MSSSTLSAPGKWTLQDAADLRVVGEASDGREALKAARRLRPDVVVMFHPPASNYQIRS